MLTIQNENETVRQREIRKAQLVAVAVSGYISKTEMSAADVVLLQEFVAEAGHVAWEAMEASPAPVFIAPDPAGGPFGSAISTPAIVATGGTPPYSYFVTKGSLPVGLTLNSDTGVVYGTAIAAGTFSIGMKDARGKVASNTADYAVTTPAAPAAPAAPGTTAASLTKTVPVVTTK